MLARRGVRQTFENLPIRWKLRACAAASAAVSVLVVAVAFLSNERVVACAALTILAIVVALIAGISLSALLHTTIVGPLDRLAAALGDIARRRDFAARLPPAGGGEIGALNTGYNALLGELDRQQGELERAAATLDEQVRERSRALSDANARLGETIMRLETARLEAEAASRAKSEFIANMSHELRQPLNAIIGFSDLMKSETLGPIANKTYLEYASDINFSGTHLLEIIADILDVARYEAGRMELKEEPAAVEEVIGEALRLIAPQAAQGRVGVEWTPPAPPLPPLFCDRVRLRQILLNLLSNAIKFTRPGGLVEIRAELGEGLQLVVSDTGIGIKPQDIAHIMTPFGQIASLYARDRQGAGLGLTLTKALIERHGGSLRLDSTPGVGTIVRVAFPAERVMRPTGEVHAN